MAHVTLADLGGWTSILTRLTAGADLDAVQAEAAMAEILEGRRHVGPDRRVHRRPADERRDGRRAHWPRRGDDRQGDAVPLPDIDGVIDIVGTGGDRAPASTCRPLRRVIAGAGGRVKHGNRAASSACGAADLLEALGVAIDLGPAGVARCVQDAGIGFCFAPRFHAAMRYAVPTRRELGVPTVFNVLGPLANPARVRRQVTGVADPSMADRMAQVLRANGTRTRPGGPRPRWSGRAHDDDDLDRP